MHHGMKRIILISVIALSALPCAGAAFQSFASLRELADKGKPYVTDVLTNFVFAEDVTELKITEISQDLYIEGYVVGSPAQFPRNENNEIAWQMGSMSASARNNARTLYLESKDGKYGFRLFFDDPKEAAAAGRLFGIIKLNLKGTTLVKEYSHYVITGLKAGNVTSFQDGIKEDLPQKVRHISELTDDDIFTWVTLEDCEFVFKNGAYMNVRETYLPNSKTGRYTGNGWMNSWARLVFDQEGESIYLGLDAKLMNRRTGIGVKPGCGEVEGVLTKAFMPRYGNGREYYLRPPSLEEIYFTGDAEIPWTAIASWDWNIKSEGLNPSNEGTGTITTDYPCKVDRFVDCDNPANVKPDEGPSRGTYGCIEDGALSLQGKTCDWWDWNTGEARSVTFTFPTEGLNGSHLAFAWTFGAGRINQETSYGYPSHWTVSYSTDGVHFNKVPEFRADLRSLPYSSGKVDGKSYETSAEAGIGYTEHIAKLPASLLGNKKVWVRLSPADRIVANMAYLHRDMMEATADWDGPCTVNIGEVQILYR